MNDRCGCVRAHGYDLTGKMTGGGLHSVAWASAITLDSTSVIALDPSYSTILPSFTTTSALAIPLWISL